jgi:hypothetical protein
MILNKQIKDYNMIKTKKVKLTPKDLFLILTLRYIKKRWWLFAWIWIIAIILASDGMNDSFDMFFIAVAIIYPIWLAIQFWRYVTSKDNRLFLLERYYEIDNEKINGIIDQDTYSPIKLDHFIKVDLIRRTYLLYMAKAQFIYIPIDSFESDSDREWFENEIVKKIKK